jgi:hypothetical protein
VQDAGRGRRELGGAMRRSRGDALAVGRDCDRVDRIAMTLDLIRPWLRTNPFGYLVPEQYTYDACFWARYQSWTVYV